MATFIFTLLVIVLQKSYETFTQCTSDISYTQNAVSCPKLTVLKTLHLSESQLFSVWHY